MPRRAQVDWAAVDAAAPFGNIRRADLRALGVADGTIADRTRRGLWTVTLPGVLRLMGGTPTEDERLDAALRYAGDDAVVSGWEAARRHGLVKHPGTGGILLLKPHGTRRRSVGDVTIERTRRPPEPRLRDGWPLAPVERAVLDAARPLRRLDQVRALVAESVQRGFTTPERLAAELEEGSQRHTRHLRTAVCEVLGGTRSAVEAWGREIALELEATGFPHIEWNRAVHGEDGHFLFTPDGWVDEAAVAWEIESVEYHLSPQDQERSYRRAARIRLADVELVEHRPSQLRDDRAQVCRDLWAAYRRALRRPRPPLVATSAS